MNRIPIKQFFVTDDCVVGSRREALDESGSARNLHLQKRAQLMIYPAADVELHDWPAHPTPSRSGKDL